MRTQTDVNDSCEPATSGFKATKRKTDLDMLVLPLQWQKMLQQKGKKAAGPERGHLVGTFAAVTSHASKKFKHIYHIGHRQQLRGVQKEQ